MSMITLKDEGYNPRTFHAERQARLKRIAAAAVPDTWNPPPKPKAVLTVVLPQPAEPEPIHPGNGSPLRIISIEQIDEYDFGAIVRKYPRIARIQQVVASYYNIPMYLFLSGIRTAPVVFPRQIAMYLCRKLTIKSMPEIGRKFGGKDHTTILHGCRKIEKLLASERQSELRHIVSMLTDIIIPPAAPPLMGDGLLNPLTKRDELPCL